MAGKLKKTGRAASIPAGLLSGLAVSLCITLLGTGIIAKTLDLEVMEEKSVGYAIMVMLITASYAGALVSKLRIKRQFLLVCVLSAALFFLSLLAITALFFGGRYEAVAVTGVLVLCGSMLALMPKGQGRRGRKRKISVRANC